MNKLLASSKNRRLSVRAKELDSISWKARELSARKFFIFSHLRPRALKSLSTAR